MYFGRRAFAAGLGSSLVAPAIISEARAQGGTIKLGMVLSVTGPAAELGRYAVAGARIAVEAVNKAGGVLGRQLELVTEDDQTTNPGAILSFSKLASQPDIVAFLGTIRSTQMHAILPDVVKVGKPVAMGATDPQLTRLGNPWLFRFRPNDLYSARVISQYGMETLGKKNWALVHSTDAFGTSGIKTLTEAIGKAGGTITLTQGYPNQSQDFTPVVLAVKQSGAEVLGTYCTFENDTGIFARQLRQLGVDLPWVGSTSLVSVTALKLAGPALYGTYSATDYAEDSSDASKAFGKAYRAVMKVAPDVQSSWTYDAVTVLSMAIAKAGSTDPQAMREAILSIKGHQGAEGEYDFDANGDGLHDYNIVENQKGAVVFSKHFDFKD